jgi:hypothetical protein
MRSLSILTLAMGAALLGGAAMAQTAAPTSPPPQADTGPMAPTASLGSPDHPIPQSSPTPVDMAYKLTPNDASVVTNGPVPDTPQNRKLYGQPMSHGGKSTAATGN